MIIDLKKLIEHKKDNIYPSHIHYRSLVPAGEWIEAELIVPELYVYIATGEHHDVVADTFTHKCVKDDQIVLPEALIDGASMDITYPEPMLVERYWLGTVHNISKEDSVFSLRVSILIVPRIVVERIDDEIEMECELKAELREAWRGMKEEERREVMLKSPELVVAIAR